VKTYHKNRCHTNGCKNSGDNAVLIQIKNHKLIIQVCDICKQQIDNRDIAKVKDSSFSCNSCSIIDPISVIAVTLENMELRFPREMNNEMKIPMKRMRRSIDKIIKHVTEHLQVKNSNSYEIIKIENLE